MVAVTYLTEVGSFVAKASNPEHAHERNHQRFRDVRAYEQGRMPKVIPGQVWADCDPRCAGRTIRVVALRRDGKAVVETVTPRSTAPRTPSEQQRDTTGDFHVIALRRFRPNSRGFRLVSNPPPPPKTAATSAPASPANAASLAAAAASGTGWGSPTAPLALPSGSTASGTTWPPVASKQPDNPAASAEAGTTKAAEIDALANRLAHGNAIVEMDYRAAAALHALFGLSTALTFINGKSEDDNPVKRYIGQGLGVLLAEASAYAYKQGLVTKWSARPKT